MPSDVTGPTPHRASRVLRPLAAALVTSLVVVACSIGSDDPSANVDVRDRPEQLEDDTDLAAPDPADAAVDGGTSSAETQEELAGFDLGSIRPGTAPVARATAVPASQVDLQFGAPPATRTPTPVATTRPSPTAGPTTAPSATPIPPTATTEASPSATAEETATAEASPTADETATAEASPTADETATAEASPTAEQSPTAEVSPTAEQSPTAEPSPTPVPTREPTPTATATGVDPVAIYANHCSVCHGPNAQGSDLFPPLGGSWQLGEADVRDRIVNGSDEGMLAFGDDLTPEEIDAIVQYVMDDLSVRPN